MKKPEPNERNRIDSAWMNSLMRESLRGAGEEDENRIQRFLTQLSNEPTHTDSKKLHEKNELASHGASHEASLEGIRRSRRRAWVWKAVTLTIAASLLIAIVFFVRPGNPSSQAQAQAAVQRCLDSWGQYKNRKYTIKMKRNRALGGVTEHESTLYLNDKNEFVLRRTKWNRFQHVWIGGSSTERWIVPERGPIIIGDENLIGRWLERKEVDTPYLNVEAMLKHLAKRYTLTSVGSESLTLKNEGTVVECDHVRGHLRDPSDRRLPSQIDLWADQRNGNAQKIEMNWHRDEDEPGPLSWTFELVGHPVLQKDWFHYRGHDRRNRTPIRVRRKEDLKQFDSQPAGESQD